MKNDERRQFVSHISDDGTRESVCDHLREVSAMAAEFARPFGADQHASLIGALHDVGKYSSEFQKRILENGIKVDHSTAGAWEALKSSGSKSSIESLLAYCVAGHHGGLCDGGYPDDDLSSGTLCGRLKRADEGRIPDYSAWSGEGALLPESPRLDMPKKLEDQKFTLAFFARMLFSCLVDADFLCTERFMNGGSRVGLKSDSLSVLRDRLERRLREFYPPKTELNATRCGILDACLAAADAPAGVFRLTVPTGGGKTHASMRFALNHALAHGNDMRRIIYAIPYTSIIEQNAKVFRSVFGDENVLEHQGNFDFDDEGERGLRLRLASENWDAPIVITTNVQLFESLFSNKTSRCRKLHNIAGSVIVLDEAQMIPVEQMKPCVAALEELVRNYGCSVVLCTATQPQMDSFFSEDCCIREIVPNVRGLFASLKRVSYSFEGILSDEALAEKSRNPHKSFASRTAGGKRVRYSIACKMRGSRGFII